MPNLFLSRECDPIPGASLRHVLGHVQQQSRQQQFDIQQRPGEAHSQMPRTYWHVLDLKAAPKAVMHVAGLFLVLIAMAAFPSSAFSDVSATEAGEIALPDGRKYEQVSPVSKNGANAAGSLSLVRAGLAGDKLGFFSEPTLPGSEGAQDFGTYIASRGTDQWTTQGVLPPPTTGLEGRFRGWSENLAYSFVTNGDEANGFTFYQRETGTPFLQPIAAVGEVSVVGTSTDGSTLLFEANKPLAEGASPEANLYLWNRTTGIRLAGSLNDGNAPPEGVFAGPYDWPSSNLFSGGTSVELYTPNALSSDGSSVYFTARGTGQLFLRQHAFANQSKVDAEGKCTEPEAACTVEVSEPRGQVPDPKPAAFLAASSKGSPVVFFSSSGKLTDDATTGPNDEGNDLYRYDSGSDSLTDITPDEASQDPAGAEVRGVLGASADGDRIYFVANGVLGDGAKEGAVHGDCTFEAQLSANQCNLYIWQLGAGIHYITTLDASGESSVSDRLDWEAGPAESQDQRQARVSEDGRTLVFRSQSNVTSFDSQGVPQFYRYEVGENPQCITCHPGGVLANRPRLFSIQIFGAVNAPPTLTRNLSLDGNRFFFESGEKLVPEDTNGDISCPEVEQISGSVPQCQDVYEWEAQGSGSCVTAETSGGCLHLISTGRSSKPAFFADADLGGDNAFFYTLDQLVGQDRDTQVDIYDARVGGGLSAQFPSIAEQCNTQSACKASTPIPPAGGPTPSSTNLVEPVKKPPLRCRKGFKKVRARRGQACVRVHRPVGKRHKKRHQKPHGRQNQKSHKSAGVK